MWTHFGRCRSAPVRTVPTDGLVPRLVSGFVRGRTTERAASLPGCVSAVRRSPPPPRPPTPTRRKPHARHRLDEILLDFRTDRLEERAQVSYNRDISTDHAPALQGIPQAECGDRTHADERPENGRLGETGRPEKDNRPGGSTVEPASHHVEHSTLSAVHQARRTRPPHVGSRILYGCPPTVARVLLAAWPEETDAAGERRPSQPKSLGPCVTSVWAVVDRLAAQDRYGQPPISLSEVDDQERVGIAAHQGPFPALIRRSPVGSASFESRFRRYPRQYGGARLGGVVPREWTLFVRAAKEVRDGGTKRTEIPTRVRADSDPATYCRSVGGFHVLEFAEFRRHCGPSGPSLRTARPA